MSEPVTQSQPQQQDEIDGADADGGAQDGAARLVPVGESIKYRRRAQQAEQRLGQIEQQLNDLQAQVKAGGEQLTAAQVQRDEARRQLQAAKTRLALERQLARSGVVDVETAAALLAERLEASQDHDEAAIASAVEQLLLDKPFLIARGHAGLPPRTAAAREPAAGATVQLSQLAQRATSSGDRRTVAEYLRLRRQRAQR
ncbi:MAG: hypothetical protein ACE15C_19230 [Phycisphaerae bacterium]